MVYALGAVKSNVRQAANDAGQMFAVGTILGVGLRAGESDHPKGLALDFMVGLDRGKGDAIAAYFIAQRNKYGVHYIIWKQHILSYSSATKAAAGWTRMEDRGGDTANHFDHVHVSFFAPGNFRPIDDVAPGPLPPGRPEDMPPGIGGGIPDALAGIKGALEAIGKAAKWVADTHNWLRVGMFLAGLLLILLGLILLAGKGKSLAKGKVT